MDNGCNFYAHPSHCSSAQNLCSSNSSRFHWINASNSTLFTTTASGGESISFAHPQPTSSDALMFTHRSNIHHYQHQCQQLTLYSGEGSHFYPEPHLMCLKLGKRHYFEDNFNIPAREEEIAGKRGKPCCSVMDGHARTSLPANVPKCQVEGCHAALINAKDYHRRHKVCEMHSKAPKVMVLGLEQRFCQQCSRFHVVSEFDESKRSCRRRLAGHNERRRKSAQDSFSKYYCQEKLIDGKFQCLASPTGLALSLLSSKADSWSSSSDVTSRSSAALRELIAEHRAAILSKHHYSISDPSQPTSNSTWSNISNQQRQILANNHNHWDRFQDSGAQAVTLDLMQAPNSALGFMPATHQN